MFKKMLQEVSECAEMRNDMITSFLHNNDLT